MFGASVAHCTVWKFSSSTRRKVKAMSYIIPLTRVSSKTTLVNPQLQRPLSPRNNLLWCHSFDASWATIITAEFREILSSHLCSHCTPLSNNSPSSAPWKSIRRPSVTLPSAVAIDITNVLWNKQAKNCHLHEYTYTLQPFYESSHSIARWYWQHSNSGTEVQDTCA